jgi:hypothetical protein
MPEPKRAAEELTVKLSIELTELVESYKSQPTPDILERIKLKEQLLIELREFLKSTKTGD